MAYSRRDNYSSRGLILHAARNRYRASQAAVNGSDKCYGRYAVPNGLFYNHPPIEFDDWSGIDIAPALQKAYQCFLPSPKTIRREVEIFIYRVNDNNECKVEVELFHRGQSIWTYWAILDPVDFAHIPFRRGIVNAEVDGFFVDAIKLIQDECAYKNGIIRTTIIIQPEGPAPVPIDPVLTAPSKRTLEGQDDYGAPPSKRLRDLDLNEKRPTTKIVNGIDLTKFCQVHGLFCGGKHIGIPQLISGIDAAPFYVTPPPKPETDFAYVETEGFQSVKN